MLLRDRFLGGVSPRMLFAPEMGAGGGGAEAPAAAAPVAIASEPAAAAAVPPATPAEPAAAPATLASGGNPIEVKPVTAPADFPADWREKAAGDDKAALNELKRYASPIDAFKALRTLKAQISAGELKPPAKPLPDNATPEQVAAWRKEQGLPGAVEDYLTNLKPGEGIVPGEADKPLLAAVADMAFKANYPQQTVNDFVGMYYKLQNQQAAQRAESDRDLEIASQQQLIAEMGQDFKPNMMACSSFWKEQPAGMADMVLGARTPEGRVLGNIPEIASWFSSLAREINPAATLLPAGGDTSASGVASRMAEIEKSMYIDGKPNPAYFGGPMEKEYRTLIDAQERMTARTKAA